METLPEKQKLELVPEVFLIPYEGRNILYAPLEGAVLDVEGGVLNFLQEVSKGQDPEKLDSGLASKLSSLNILTDSPSRLPPRKSSQIYTPTSVTLLPTYNCNLRCMYCYSRGGEEVGEVMERNVAKASIELIVENALKAKRKSVSLGFHGGGEPLLPGNMHLINFATEYLRELTEKNRLGYSLNCTSNGVFNSEIFDWATKNLSHLNLSLDGPKDIQDRQRPLFGGHSSFDRIIENIGKLESLSEGTKQKFGYSIRATITAESVERMPEILEFFASISSNKSFHLEPLFECGRCSTTNLSSPNPQRFTEKMLETLETAKRLGREVYYSGASIGKVGENFCGACGDNFFVTPRGDITTCLEASRAEDILSNIFFIGKYNSLTGSFDIDQSKRETLLKRKVTDIDFCRDCFAKYNCSGDCPAKVFEQSGNFNDPSNNWRCAINRDLLIHELVSKLDSPKKKDLNQEKAN